MNFNKIATALLIVCLWSCSDDETSYKYSFIDQEASGKIGDTNWTYAEGSAGELRMNDAPYLHIRLFLEQPEAPCDVFTPDLESDWVFFETPAEVGLYNAKNEWVSFVDFGADFPDITVEKGAIEILSITETEVTGRIDLYYNSKSYVNGNFTATICN